MLAPMQGLTNAALRACYMERYQPDVVFSEFVRVQERSRKRIVRADLRDITGHHARTPLVVQLIGRDPGALADAARKIQDTGCRHVNLNLGCPYGRMTTGATGGELLNEPALLPALLTALRKAVSGSFSVKCRAGYRNPRQIFKLLPLFADHGVDFLVLHPRTVVQKYAGSADHDLTCAVAAHSRMPVIANGDLNRAENGRKLMADPGIAGLMLGRGALADPLLFQRLRGDVSAAPEEPALRKELAGLMADLMPRYLTRFCGERQALMKLKDILNFVGDERLQRDLGKLKRAASLARFEFLLEKNFAPPERIV